MRTSLNLILFLISLSAISQFDDRFYFPNKELKNIPDSIKYDEHTFKVENETLHGILLYSKSKKKGTVFFLHGAGGNVTTYLPMSVPYTKNGYDVFMIDFRGYGKSTGTPTHLNIEKDILVVFDNVMTFPEFEGRKTIVHGASMGTQAAAILARERPFLIELLILDGAISSFTDIAIDTAPEEQKATISMFLKSPYALKEIIKSTNGLKKWIIHSKEDSGVPYSHSMKIYDNASEPKFMWTYQGEHLEAIQKHEVEFFNRLNQILSQKTSIEDSEVDQ